MFRRDLAEVLGSASYQLEVALEREDPETALGIIEAVLRSEATFRDSTAALLVLKGLVLRDLGRTLEAKDAFLSAAQQHPVRPSILLVTLFEASRELGKLGAFSEAYSVLTQALSLYRKGVTEGFFPDRLASALGKNEDVSSFLDPGASVSEVEGKLLLARAHVARQAGHIDYAIMDLSRIINDPEYPGFVKAAAYLDRGVIYFDASDIPAALQDLRSVGSTEGSFERQRCDAYFNLAQIYLVQGQFGQAAQAIACFDSSPLPPVKVKADLWRSLLEELIAEGLLLEAASFLNDLKRHEGNEEFRILVAMVLVATGESDEALKIYESLHTTNAVAAAVKDIRSLINLKKAVLSTKIANWLVNTSQEGHESGEAPHELEN